MGGGENDTATGAMVCHKIANQSPAVKVERGERFVEQPKRAPHEDQAGECDATLLSGGQILRRYIAQIRKAAPLKRLVNTVVSPEIARVKFQMFGRSKLGLDGILVPDPADERAALVCAHNRTAIVQPDDNASGCGFEKTRYGAQERCLAGAIAPADREAAARGGPKIQTALHHALAADKRDILNLQFGERPHFINTYAVHR